MLTTLDSGDSKAILMWFPKNVPKIHDCSDRHKSVVKAYNDLREMVNPKTNVK